MTKLFFLGPPEVCDDRGARGRLCAQTQQLIGYVTTRPGRNAPREALAHVLWSACDTDKSRARLNTAIWRCRKMLSDTGRDPDAVLDCSSDRVAVRHAAPLWLDFEDLRASATILPKAGTSVLEAADARRLDAAVRLYRGAFLEGCDADWCLIERESLNMSYQTILERLMRHHGALGNWRRVVEMSNRLLALDPLLEHVHRAKIRAYGALGERAKAADQYIRVRDLLSEELGVSPFPETEEAFKSAMSLRAAPIRTTSANIPGAPSRRRRASQPKLAAVIADLKSAITLLEEIDSER